MGLLSIGMKKLPTRLSANQMIFSTPHLNLVPTQPFKLTGDLQYLAESRWKHSEGNCGKELELQLTETQIAVLGGKANLNVVRLEACTWQQMLYWQIEILYILYTLPTQESRRTLHTFRLWSGSQGCLTLVIIFMFSSTLISPFCVLSLTSLRHTYLAQRCSLALFQLHIKTHSQNRI